VARGRRQLDIEGQMLAPKAVAQITANDTRLDLGADNTIPVRIYRASTPTPSSPALVYFHGGGFVLGSLDSHDAPCRQIAAAAGCVVISVGYRLGAEAPFPA